jgi:hypothetical protein
MRPFVSPAILSSSHPSHTLATIFMPPKEMKATKMPYVKPRSKLTPKEKLEEMSHEAWKRDCIGRQYETERRMG